MDAKTTTGVTALWLAAGEGRKDVTSALIGRGADVNNQRRDGITAVMAAAIGGYKVQLSSCSWHLVHGGSSVRDVSSTTEIWGFVQLLLPRRLRRVELHSGVRT